MGELLMDAAAALIWVVAIILMKARVMEMRQLEYTLMRSTMGLYFHYRLGIYAGKVDLLRDMNVNTPQITQGVFGWECRFPVDYSVLQMCEYIRWHVASLRNVSHSKDMLVFNEIVNHKNDALISINGHIYSYDNSDHKPFYR